MSYQITSYMAVNGTYFQLPKNNFWIYNRQWKEDGLYKKKIEVQINDILFECFKWVSVVNESYFEKLH